MKPFFFSEHAPAKNMKSFFSSNRKIVKIQIINMNRAQWAAWTKLLFLQLFLSGVVHSFNVDVTSKVIHNAPQRSCEDGDCMFGFSVAQHREKNQPW